MYWDVSLRGTRVLLTTYLLIKISYLIVDVRQWQILWEGQYDLIRYKGNYTIDILRGNSKYCIFTDEREIKKTKKKLLPNSHNVQWAFLSVVTKIRNVPYPIRFDDTDTKEDPAGHLELSIWSCCNKCVGIWEHCILVFGG